MRSPLLLIVLVAGCSFDPSGPATTDDGSPDDGAAIDSAVIDGATIDGATIDAAAIDARITDAAAIDAPPPIDARPIDAPPPIDARPIDAPPPRCVGYQVVTGAPATSRYRKVNTLTTWAGADADCTSDGGYLVIPGSMSEAVAIGTFVNPAGTSPYYWAGIEDPERDGVWTTVLGATQTYLPWAPAQPNARAGEIYVLVEDNGRFWDWYDDGTQEYACECNP